MRCLGRTQTLRQCRRECNFLFCRDHRLQPMGAVLAVLSVIGLFAGLYQDLWKPLISSRQERITQALVSPRKDTWWGVWKTEKRPFKGAHLEIRETTSGGFSFSIELFDGMHTGNIEGKTKFTDVNQAIYDIKTNWPNENDICELKFLKIKEPILHISIKQTDGCGSFHGSGTSFDGIYLKEYDTLIDAEILDEFELTTLYEITGNRYSDLADRFQLTYYPEIDDASIQKVIGGSAKGMFTIYEGIIMTGINNAVWAAYTDGETIWYFTNVKEFRTTLPQIFESWKSEFSDRPIIFVLK